MVKWKITIEELTDHIALTLYKDGSTVMVYEIAKSDIIDLYFSILRLSKGLNGHSYHI